PNYMPPEQARGEVVDYRSDVYSLGATLYCLLTARPPFQAASVWETIDQDLAQDPVPPRRLNAAIPKDLETICLKCLAKSPASRYGDMDSLAEDLSRFLQGRPILARPVGFVEQTWKLCRRRPGAAAALAMGVVAVGLL